jgi:peptidyl-prolyl cis-trans isomerase C
VQIGLFSLADPGYLKRNSFHRETHMKRAWLHTTLALSVAAGSSLFAQNPTGKEVPAMTTSLDKSAVAARVNNRPVPETSVQRALKAIPTEERTKARPEIVQFLIDNLLVDQYLEALKVTVEPKDVEKQFEDFKAEVKKHNQDYAKVLENLMLTEAELKEQILGQIRWERFVASQATPETLKKMFDAHIDVFDGSMVRARHILVKAETEKEKADAQTRIAQIKAACEKAVGDALAKLPAETDAAKKEQYRLACTEEAFSQLAKSYSACPSGKEGGELNWFPRAGSMVEAFAKAAFAVKPGTLSDVVTTQHGYHLILVTSRKQGVPTDFEKVKEAVKEFYEGKLREAVTTKMRQQSKIEIADIR